MPGILATQDSKESTGASNGVGEGLKPAAEVEEAAKEKGMEGLKKEPVTAKASISEEEGHRSATPDSGLRA